MLVSFPHPDSLQPSRLDHPPDLGRPCQRPTYRAIIFERGSEESLDLAAVPKVPFLRRPSVGRSANMRLMRTSSARFHHKVRFRCCDAVGRRRMNQHDTNRGKPISIMTTYPKNAAIVHPIFTVLSCPPSPPEGHFSRGPPKSLL